MSQQGLTKRTYNAAGLAFKSSRDSDRQKLNDTYVHIYTEGPEKCMHILLSDILRRKMEMC
jgi:GrpB-like predicted nucleotidyltransferase (UPF0157 family)